MKAATQGTGNNDVAPQATDAEADWGDLESRFYRFLGNHERIGEVAQQHIFSWYARQFVPGQRVLDVGSGLGDFLDLLSARGVQGFGVDPDPGMVAAARQRGHTIFADDARQFLQITRRRFDGVFMGNFVEHFPPKALLTLLKGAYRVLQPGGLLILATPDPRSLHVHLQEFWRDATHVRLYDRDLLAFLVETCGFRVQEIGSNDATAYNPADEWFGEAFAQRLAGSARRSVPPPVGRAEAAAGTDAEADAPSDVKAILRDQRARIDDLERRLRRLMDVVTRAQQETATARATPDHTTAAAALVNGHPDDTDTLLPYTTASAGSDTDTPLPAPMLTIPERRAAATLRRWRAQHSEPRQPDLPLPYHRPQATEMDTPVPQLVIDLLMSVRDEVRGVVATSRDHKRALRSLEAWLTDLGAIVGLTQQEAMLVAQDAQQAIRDIHTARRVDADQITRQFDDLRDTMHMTAARVAAEEQARDAMDATADQIIRQLDDLRDTMDATAVRVAATDLGAIVGLTQQEAILVAQAVHERLHTIEQTAARLDERLIQSAQDAQQAIRDIHTARRVDADQITRQLDDLRDTMHMTAARVAAEEQARDAMATLIRTQLGAFLTYLYPPREYYLIAARASTPAQEER